MGLGLDLHSISLLAFELEKMRCADCGEVHLKEHACSKVAVNAVRSMIEELKGPPLECCNGCVGECAVRRWYRLYGDSKCEEQ